jgi:N-acetylneuraminate synthase/N,N'-diacetyllegionaminate synthase
MRPAEAENKREFQRVIVASKQISNGDALEFSNVTMGRVSGGKGLQPNLLEMVIGRRAKRDYSRGEAIEL